MWLELFIEYNGPSLLCEFVSVYTQATEKNLVRILKIKNETQRNFGLPEMPILIIESKNVIKGELDICRHIAKLTGTYEVLFGSNSDQEKQNLEFIHQFNLSADYATFLNNHLLTRTFCNGNYITISDLYAFAFVIQELLKLSDDKKLKYCNVIRWADHVQNLKGMKEQLDRLKFIVSLPFEPLLLEPPKICIEEKKTKKDKGGDQKPQKGGENKANVEKKDEQPKEIKEKGIFIFYK